MFTLDDIRAEYARLDKKCGVDTSKIPLKISTRAVRQRGVCRYGVDQPVRCISFSKFIFEEEADTFWQTVRHEYAHALVRLRFPKQAHGHDKVWKQACLEVGCRPERVSRRTDAQDKTANRKAKYRLSCDTCGNVWTFFRATSYIKRMKAGEYPSIICPECGGVKFSLELLNQQ